MDGLRCDRILLADGWADDITLVFEGDGTIAEVRPARADDGFRRAGGPVIPGMPNLHSHAFQRATAGLTQRAGPVGDDFWSWRQAVYRFVARLTPDDVEAIAAQLYVDMLKAGYTSVGEFHYLHHDPDGRAYADPAEMSRRVVAASETAGIGLTLLPVRYAQGGFGGVPTEEGQRRYVTDDETYARIVEEMAAASAAGTRFRVGIAPHSLRAVGPEALGAALSLIGGIGTAAPVHIHIAEQVREVEECVAWSGARPVEWLLANAEVDARWCLVHATHMTEEETRGLAGSGAVTGLCPTTEADLGDGLFPAPEYWNAGGFWGIGSDSHVVVDPAEDLRLLEFGQRLVHRRRNLLGGGPESSTGGSLWRAGARGGARALGITAGRVEPGARADLVVLDGDALLLAGKREDAILDSLVFSGGRTLVRDVWVAGRQVVDEGRHTGEEDAAKAYGATMDRLLAEQGR